MDIVDDLGKIVIDKNGKDVEYDVLLTFNCEELGKNYIVYTDNEFTNNKKNIYVSSYDPIIGTDKLDDITDSDELEMVLDVLNQIK